MCFTHVLTTHCARTRSAVVTAALPLCSLVTSLLYASTVIKRNDVLFTIDQHDVYKQTIDQVRPLILGLPGSTVVLGFQRQGTIIMRNVTQQMPHSKVLPGDSSLTQGSIHNSARHTT